MPSSLLQYHRNNISSCDTNHHPRTITAYYSYYGKHPQYPPYNTYKPSGSYILFVSGSGDSGDKNIYIETQSVSIIIPYKDLHKYHKLYVYYIISQQLTPRNSKVYYSDTGYKGVYKELRYWYILTNICWKSLYLSFGDYCYFKENPLSINLSVCDTKDTIDDFLDLFNSHYYNECPYKICDWLIKYEANVIENELYHNELIVNREETVYELLQIVKRHFGINEDIVLKIYEYIVFDVEHKICV